MILMTFLRKKCRLSQKELANLLNVTQTLISLYENELAVPEEGVLNLIAQQLQYKGNPVDLLRTIEPTLTNPTE